MASVIRPVRQYRKTAWRKKYLTQSQRWGKVVITMPIPQGDITTTEIINPEPPLPEEPTEVEEKEEERENE